MRDRLSARHLADEALPGMPATERGVRAMAEREGWGNQPGQAGSRDGPGGGTEYGVELLPTLAQVAFAKRHLTVDAPARSGRAALENDARLAVVAAFEAFGRGLHVGSAAKLQLFVDAYNAGSITVADWVRKIVPTAAKRTLIRWRSKKREDASALGFDRAAARAGTGAVDTANGGEVCAHILALLAAQPHLAADEIRDACLFKFGASVNVRSKGVETAIPMPPLSAFQRAIARLKVRHKVELTALTNPDAYKSKMALRGTGMLRHVKEPNQLWMIDASPADALCTDARHSIYVCLDVAPRRMICLMSRTPRAEAVALLIRKAIIAWGAPDLVMTDNGSDFTARDTERLFLSLGIETETADEYSPEQKAHVERAIKTLQHKCITLMPGYVGHSVADRKAIEGRKSFAQRMGDTDAETFSVSLTAAQMQALIDEWAAVKYGNRPHAGLKGVAPNMAAMKSARQRRDVDVRALDLLVLPVADGGTRVVTAQGVRVDHRFYLAPFVRVGTVVLVRQDPADLGRTWLFTQDGGEFLGEALCPEFSGVDAGALVAAAKAVQRDAMAEATRDIKRRVRDLKRGPALIEQVNAVAARDAPNVIALPRRRQEHTTPQIAAAIQAMSAPVAHLAPTDPAIAAAQRRLMEEAEAAAAAELIDALSGARIDAVAAERLALLADNVTVLPETERDRFRRHTAVLRAIAADEPVDAVTAAAAGSYRNTHEFRALAGLYGEDGDAWAG